MIDAIRVGSSILRYRGGEGQWAWAIHRVAGIGVLAFLALHIADIFVAAFGPALFNDLLFLYKGPVARIGEILLAFGLLYHAINGLRIIVADFVPAVASLKTARMLFYGQIVIFLALFIPASYMMMLTLPPPYGNNPGLAIAVTVGILALPAVVAILASFTPAAFATALDSDESTGNYQDAFKRILIGTQRRRMDRFELNVWLFMRISGFLLIVLALLHMYILHFMISVEAITFNTLIERWQDPVQGWFWRSYDLALLAFAFTHGMLGLRYVIEDYVHSISWRRLLLYGSFLVWLVLILMGAWIIFFFRGSFA